MFSADNILLCREKESISIKVTDFGLATRINTAVKFRTKPVGTMTQWSPEKAECVGYGYPAEVWAAVCVLVHMLSGLPPWMRRYGGLKSLIVVVILFFCLFASVCERNCNVRQYLRTCVFNKDSDQPVHLHSPVKVFVVHRNKLCNLGYRKCAKWSIWWDSANLLMLWLKYLQHRIMI